MIFICDCVQSRSAIDHFTVVCSVTLSLNVMVMHGNEFTKGIFYIDIFKCALQASDLWTKTRPQHRELRALLFTMSVWVL